MELKPGFYGGTGEDRRCTESAVTIRGQAPVLWGLSADQLGPATGRFREARIGTGSITRERIRSRLTRKTLL